MFARFALEKASSAQHLPQHDANGVNVRGYSTGIIVCDFWRHVTRLGKDDAGNRVTTAVVSPCRAKINQFYISTISQHDVLWTQIAVYNVQRLSVRVSALVYVRKSVAKCHRNRHCIGPGNCDAQLLHAQPHFAQVAPFDMLEHTEGLAGGIKRSLVYTYDSRMLQL